MVSTKACITNFFLFILVYFSQVVGELVGAYTNYWLPESFVTSIGIALNVY